MKIKLNQIISTLVQGKKTTITRLDEHCVSIKTLDSEIEVSIVLPLSFELEQKSVEQLCAFAWAKSADEKAQKACIATADLHPTGAGVAVGSVVLSPHDTVYPQAIGSDINCGMRLIDTGLGLEEFLANKQKIIDDLRPQLLLGSRDVPSSSSGMRALARGGIGEYFKEEINQKVGGLFSRVRAEDIESDLKSLHSIYAGMTADERYLPSHLTQREKFRDPNLATLGGGNHFMEFQVVQEVYDRHTAWNCGVKKGNVVCMIHTGSREVGFYIGGMFKDLAKSQWPKGKKHEQILSLQGEMAKQYMIAQATAAMWALANRTLLAHMVTQSIRKIVRDTEHKSIIDVPHNICSCCPQGILHRKGAAVATQGELVVVPGSMAEDSYLMKSLGSQKWLDSISHGAGRSSNRARATSCNQKDRKKKDGGEWEFQCETLSQSRLVEEGPWAYKSINEVIDSQSAVGMASKIARLKPIVTFKA